MRRTPALLLSGLLLLSLSACEGVDGDETTLQAGAFAEQERLISAPGALGPIVINELSAGEGRVELFNRSSTTYDVSGWYLVNTRFDVENAHVLPEGTELAPGEFLILGGDEQALELELRDEDGVFLFAPSHQRSDSVLWLQGEAATSLCRVEVGESPLESCDPS